MILCKVTSRNGIILFLIKKGKCYCLRNKGGLWNGHGGNCRCENIIRRVLRRSDMQTQGFGESVKNP